MSKLQIVRQLPHEPARVFSALTDPAKMSQWFVCLENGRVKVSNDLWPGGKYVIEMSNDEKTAVIRGVYLEIVPPKKLVFTWNSDSAKDSKVTIELSPIPEGTKLVITHELPEDAIPGHRAGWIVCFDNLEIFLGREPNMGKQKQTRATERS
jgi:uncharacterized protein YndB with AHSA1/START domain